MLPLVYVPCPPGKDRCGAGDRSPTWDPLMSSSQVYQAITPDGEYVGLSGLQDATKGLTTVAGAVYWR